MKQKGGDIKQYSIESMDDLIKSIKQANPLITEEGIAVDLGYNEGYISQTRSRGIASDKFLNALRGYLGRLQNAKTTEEPTKPEAQTPIERALENLTLDKLKSTAIIERLVTLLERQLDPHNATVTSTGENLRHKKTSTKAG